MRVAGLSKIILHTDMHLLQRMNNEFQVVEVVENASVPHIPVSISAMTQHQKFNYLGHVVQAHCKTETSCLSQQFIQIMAIFSSKLSVLHPALREKSFQIKFNSETKHIVDREKQRVSTAVSPEFMRLE